MKKLDRVASCMQGIVRPLKESKDDAFAQGLSGDGVLVTPTYNKEISPFKGKVVFVFDTLHAIILRRDSDGLAFVLHVGYETNKLTGKEFKVPVKTGDDVVAGDVIMEMDFDYLKECNYDYDTHILFPSLGVGKIAEIHYGEIDYMETLLTIRK